MNQFLFFSGAVIKTNKYGISIIKITSSVNKFLATSFPDLDQQWKMGSGYFGQLIRRTKKKKTVKKMNHNSFSFLL